jgi:hypothetical protein
LKLFVVSGFAFAAAFNTKLYAVFVLIPLLAAFLYCRPKKTNSLLLWLAVFFLPVLVSSFFWYETVAGIGMDSIFLHPDLFIQIPAGTAPTYFFATNFLVSYGLGWLFIDAAVFSLFISLVQRRLMLSFVLFDLLSVAVIISVIGVNTVLGAVFNLRAPFQNAFKYDYQALPFLCFLAASLLSKSLLMLKQSKTKNMFAKSSLFAGGLLGLILISATLFYNIRYTQFFSMWDYLIFRVDPSVDAGYSLFNAAPIAQNSPLTIIQLAGFALAISGLVWAGRHKIVAVATYLYRRYN